jgi:hypothetical protein
MHIADQFNTRLKTVELPIENSCIYQYHIWSRTYFTVTHSCTLQHRGTFWNLDFTEYARCDLGKLWKTSCICTKIPYVKVVLISRGKPTLWTTFGKAGHCSAHSPHLPLPLIFTILLSYLQLMAFCIWNSCSYFYHAMKFCHIVHLIL